MKIIMYAVLVASLHFCNGLALNGKATETWSEWVILGYILK